MNVLLDEMRKRIEEEIEKPLPFFEVEFLERIRTLDDLRALVPIAKELQPIAWDAARILGASDEEAGYIAGDDILAPKPVEVKPPEPVVLHNYDYRNMDRKTQNAILKQNGYWWRKITEDEIEDFGWFDTEPGWHLYSSDKREVSVRRAFDEINRGVEIVALEIAEREAAENRAIEHKRQVKTRASQIADYIRSTGEYPAGDHLPEGDRMLDTQNIYGGGDWFVVGQKYIWYVQNNGMDGDNWSRNNVATGGAGGIGHRIEFDQAIADELRRLNAGEL